MLIQFCAEAIVPCFHTSVPYALHRLGLNWRKETEDIPSWHYKVFQEMPGKAEGGCTCPMPRAGCTLAFLLPQCTFCMEALNLFPFLGDYGGES